MDAQAGLPPCYWHATKAGFLRSRPYSDIFLFPGLTGLDGLPGRDGEPGLLGRKGEQGDMGIPGKDGPLYTETIKLCPLDVYVCQFQMYERISFKISQYPL